MSTLDRINRNLFGGRPQLRNTGVSLATVLKLLTSGESVAGILALHPTLESDDVQAAMDLVVSALSAPDAATRAAGELGLKRGELIALFGGQAF
jgi:uncharacterized protein (DUF433 family)